MTDAQTEARAIAQASLWVPAKPEMERIARAVYDSTGYDAPMEVVEFVMAEADRRHRTALTNALAAKDAELTDALDRLDLIRIDRDRLAAQLAEARKALEPFADNAFMSMCENHEDDYYPDWSPFVSCGQYRNARRALEAQGGK